MLRPVASRASFSYISSILPHLPFCALLPPFFSLLAPLFFLFLFLLPSVATTAANTANGQY
uniref:Uncharacterized protein n=1 Tax=Nelumbo nucifera TaxID=4432 RepID=A0A822YVT0_NELNU|nr:TPA_asm: hypothetical protein HUJ06_008845 [Nelumbo nucifera]